MEKVISKKDIDLISIGIQFAFEAGKWAGQVELEEHNDNEQYGSCAIESVYSRKTTMPLHNASKNREVVYNLRSLEWRKGVIKSSEKYKEKALEIILKVLLENNIEGEK